MSNQLKLLLYIVFVVAIFYFVQTKFNLFDISILNNDGTKTNVSTNTDTSTDVAGTETKQNYVEITRGTNTSVKVDVEIADDDQERRLGLSFRKYLGDYNGMLFVYDNEVSNTFWMKDMEIPLDMIFIDDQNFIVDIKEGLEQCTLTFCPSISSKEPYKYVLEVNSGFCINNGISIGNSMLMHLESLD